jgi:hypothetical protein
MANWITEYPERFKTLELETMLEALHEVRPKLTGRRAVSVAKAINSIESVLEMRGAPKEGEV